MIFNKKKIVKAVMQAVCFSFALTLSACYQNTDWVKFRGEGGLGVSNSRISPPLAVKWKIQLQFDTDIIRTFNPPIVMGDTIYFGSGDGNFYALDVESGFMRWVFRSGAEINSIPSADRDKVYFGSKDGRVYALSRNDGQEIWNFRTSSQVNSQVERYGDYIIFVGDADAIYFLNPDGEEEFTIDNPGWYHFTFLMADNVMYFATGPRTELIGPFDLRRRDFLWFLPMREISSFWYSFPAVRDNLVYFGTVGNDGFGFHAYHRQTGQLVWRQESEGVWSDHWTNEDILRKFFVRDIELLDFMAPTVWRDLVIFTGGDNVARAFDARTGVIRWERKFDMPGSSAPTIAGDKVYFGLLGDETTPPRLVCISARNGALLWQMETDGSLLSAPVIAGRRIIFGTDRSVFYVLEQVF